MTSRSLRHFRRAAGVVAAALLAACSTPATRVVLLPQESAAPSAVIVRAKGGEQALTKPYERATAPVGASGAPVLDQADPARVQADNRTLFDLVPPRAQRFTVFFGGGGTALTAESEQAMAEALAAAQSRSGGEIIITGHTDTLGPGPQNDDLSRQRAQIVRQLFIDRQFPANRVEAVGRGERELAVPTADEVDEPRNRRVTIEVR